MHADAGAIGLAAKQSGTAPELLLLCLRSVWAPVMAAARPTLLNGISMELWRRPYCPVFNKNWDELTSDILEKNFEVLNWLSPEDFCYYIAGVIYVSINENNPELLVINSIINILNRSCNLSYWDENFSKRWTLFNNSELDVIYEWIIWLSSHKIYDEISLLRSLYCIEYIKNIINNY